MKDPYMLYKTALRDLNKYANDLSNAERLHKQEIDDLESKSDSLAPNALRAMIKTANELHQTAVKKMATAANDALDVIREHKDFLDVTLDFQSPKLQAAVAIINALGKELPHEEQLSMIQEFRGQIPELRFLSRLFEKNGLYFAQQAKEMTEPISDFAIDEMTRAIGRALYGDGVFTLAGNIKQMFLDAVDRYGWNVDALDPFVQLLVDMFNSTSDERGKAAIHHLIKRIQEPEEDEEELSVSEKNAQLEKIVSNLERNAADSAVQNMDAWANSHKTIIAESTNEHNKPESTESSGDDSETIQTDTLEE